jgi:hypothetical protein
MTSLVEKTFPFTCREIHGECTADLSSGNDLLFALLECIAEGIHIRRQQDFGSDTERLEHKLNLVIFMLNNVVQPPHTRPDSRLLRLETDAISWQSERVFEASTCVYLEIFLDPMLPIPLRSILRIETCRDGWCRAPLTDFSDEALSSWSRWVFRQHRQQIAMAREHGELALHGVTATHL